MDGAYVRKKLSTPYHKIIMLRIVVSKHLPANGFYLILFLASVGMHIGTDSFMK